MKEGRPRLYGGELVVKKSFSLEKNITDWIEKKSGKNVSQFVNNILKEAKEIDDINSENAGKQLPKLIPEEVSKNATAQQ